MMMLMIMMMMMMTKKIQILTVVIAATAAAANAAEFKARETAKSELGQNNDNSSDDFESFRIDIVSSFSIYLQNWSPPPPALEACP